MRVDEYYEYTDMDVDVDVDVDVDDILLQIEI